MADGRLYSKSENTRRAFCGAGANGVLLMPNFENSPAVSKRKHTHLTDQLGYPSTLVYSKENVTQKGVRFKVESTASARKSSKFDTNTSKKERTIILDEGAKTTSCCPNSGVARLPRSHQVPSLTYLMSAFPTI
jgi:hypothetical protein